MRICLVGGVFDSAQGKTPRYTPETILAEGLRARGHQVTTSSHGDFRPSPEHDLIHVHHVGRAAHLLACTGTRAPFVFTGHDGQMLCGYEHNPLRKLAFARCVQGSDCAVALSEAEARYLGSLAPGVRVATIPNGIPDPWQDTPLPPEGRAGLLYVGQLIALKGVDSLLRALAHPALAARPRLKLVYHSSVEERPLRALAQSLGLADRVDFLGPRPPAAVARLLAEAEALVLPTHAESLPSVVTEALLAGTPVIASAVGGIPEQAGPHGRLVPPGAPAALAEAIRALLASPPHPAAREAMRAWARERYSIPAMIDRHLALYEQVLARGPGARRGRSPLDALQRGAVAAYWGARERGRKGAAAR